MDAKPCKLSRCVKANVVLPPDTQHHHTLFGGRLMQLIDEVAVLSATRHARKPCVTASTDSVDFLSPVRVGDSICLVAYVTWTSRTSMEVFIRSTAEDLMTGERRIAAVSFQTLVAIDDNGKPVPVPEVIPETEEEEYLFRTAPMRAISRKKHREETKELIETLTYINTNHLDVNEQLYGVVTG
ncbi:MULTISPECIES: acyl-CoA thioesterase [Metabacillus]|jgi:acyl-CoA hydrolase|uniref:Acyl-CoA thioesterase n=2 Tax=Metabacillus TaxID=2675233 RepID=A0A179T1L5_9BACI|nr:MULTISPECIES: acyl-CoA thioesterase [Metabacillus]OAS87956.1 acyl-CoA thioesterase [Metabacillus litoralis]QNF27081.1 acyl-CoA thioesterase [Metabacillus sp. KUDC1714]